MEFLRWYVDHEGYEGFQSVCHLRPKQKHILFVLSAFVSQ